MKMEMAITGMTLLTHFTSGIFRLRYATPLIRHQLNRPFTGDEPERTQQWNDILSTEDQTDTMPTYTLTTVFSTQTSLWYQNMLIKRLLITPA